MSHQLAFDLPAHVSMGAEDFFTSPANATAFAQVIAPQAWPQGKLCLIGPEGAGKSHIARVFAARTGAEILSAPELTPDSPRPAGATVIEDADRLPGPAQEWLFHHHNALAGRAPLLLTGRSEPARWPLTLPDLASRMQATAIARIVAPDEPLLTALLLKLFADRQIAPDPALPAYLLARIDRSHAAAARAVAQLDAAALALHRPVSKQLAVDLFSGRLPEFTLAS